jgi:hypothetical protein
MTDIKSLFRPSIFWDTGDIDPDEVQKKDFIDLYAVLKMRCSVQVGKLIVSESLEFRL